MPVLHRLRAYHALLAILVAIAYASGEIGPLHSRVGYAVALVVIGRLLWALTGAPQLGLMRFYPRFRGIELGTVMTHPAISRTLLLGIAACLIGATATGIALDRGRTLGMAGTIPAAATARDGAKGRDTPAKAHEGKKHGEEDDQDEGALSEVHEAFANLLVIIVGLHVVYLLLFKRPLARFMLFLDRPGP